MRSSHARLRRRHRRTRSYGRRTPVQYRRCWVPCPCGEVSDGVGRCAHRPRAFTTPAMRLGTLALALPKLGRDDVRAHLPRTAGAGSAVPGKAGAGAGHRQDRPVSTTACRTTPDADALGVRPARGNRSPQAESVVHSHASRLEGSPGREISARKGHISHASRPIWACRRSTIPVTFRDQPAPAGDDGGGGSKREEVLPPWPSLA